MNAPTFEDLEFHPHKHNDDMKRASVRISERMEVSVLRLPTSLDFLNGKEVFEVALLRDGDVVQESVSGRMTEQGVTECLRRYFEIAGGDS